MKPIHFALSSQLALVLFACGSSALPDTRNDAGADSSEPSTAMSTASSDTARRADGGMLRPSQTTATAGSGPDLSAEHADAAAGRTGPSTASKAGVLDAAVTDAGQAKRATLDDDGGTSPDDDAGPHAVSCLEAMGNTACSYAVSSGRAVITSIEAAPAGENNCASNPVKVSFTWQPDDPQSARCAKGTAQSYTFEVGDGKNPPRSCIDAASLRVGSHVTVLRQDIVTGTCTPVVFNFGPLAQQCTAKCSP